MLEWHEVIVRLGTAALIGAAIGVNRDLHHKPSGLRTLSLVGLGSALAVMVAEASSDPGAVARVIQGVITGIGFLGAGVIVREATQSKVHGLTTAAATWLTACLGCAAGAGLWLPTLTAMALAAFILLLGGALEKRIHHFLDGNTRSDDDPPSHV